MSESIRKEIEVTCVECGKVYLSKCANARFCSKKCSIRFFNHKYASERVREPIVKNCKYCGVEYSPKRSNSIFCSKKCQWKDSHGVSKEPDSTCPTCGALFSKTARTRKYCAKCSGVLHHSKRTRIRPDLIENQKNTCPICHEEFVDGVKTAIHHLDGSGYAETPNNSLENLVVLHDSCHRKLHHLTLLFSNGEWSIDPPEVVVGLGLKIVKV